MQSSKQKSISIKDKMRPIFYLTPSLVPILILGVLPIIYTIYLSFTNFNINNLENIEFVGLSNYINVLTGDLSKIFLPVFIWNVIFAVLTTFGSFFIGLIFALVLSNPNMKESKFYKAVLIIPWALPATIAVLTWQGLLNQTYGGINILLKTLGFAGNIPWLSDPNWARVGIVLVSFWLGFPYMMNICIGALSAIPETYYEAADIDGATRWQKFKNITLPSITATSLPLLISSFAFNFTNFGAAFLITGGGPARVGQQYAGYTDILLSSTYKLSMTNNRYEIASALSVLIFILIGSISLINMKKTNAFKED